MLMALRAVLAGFGLPMALYTDRAGWAFQAATAGGPVDRTHLTVVGRILARLGIDHIPSYSPQARGRVERLNRTLQGRLVNELRVAGVTTLEAANTSPARAIHPRLQPRVRPPAGRSRQCVRARRRGASTSTTCSPRTGSGFRARQCRELRGPRLTTRQAARAAELHGPARPSAAASHRRAHRLARPAVPGPRRSPGRPARRAAASRAKPPPPPLRPVGSPTERMPARDREDDATAHVAIPGSPPAGCAQRAPPRPLGSRSVLGECVDGAGSVSDPSGRCFWSPTFQGCFLSRS